MSGNLDVKKTFSSIKISRILYAPKSPFFRPRTILRIWLKINNSIIKIN